MGTFHLFMCLFLQAFMKIHGIEAELRIEPWGKVVSGEEFCEYEKFKAQCSSNEVINILLAEYGHMEIGKCIMTDLGYFGCKADVTTLVGRHCNGQSSCILDFDDQELRSTRPCSVVGITLYLKTSYVCLKVVPDFSCGSLSARPEQQFISTVQLYSSSCVSSEPYVIIAQPGQKINISLIDILDNGILDSSTPIHVMESSTGEQLSIKGGRRPSQISKTHSITIVVDDPEMKHQYVIGYQAVGCPDISSPRGTTVSRRDNEAVVFCVDRDESWTLTCRGVHWLGIVGNCTQSISVNPKTIEAPPTSAPEHNLLLDKDVIYLIVVCATVFLSVLVVTVGYVCLRRAQIKCTIQQPTKDPEWLGTAQMTLLAKPRPNSDYMTPQYVPEASPRPQPAIYDTPLPDPPAVSTANRSTVKRNNEEDYTASLSSNSTDYTRKYFVLDKDYVNTKNLINI